MEDRKNSQIGKKKAASSAVVRQFSPSRIKKLLLTRLFDLAEDSGSIQAERLVRSTGLLASDVLPIPSAHNQTTAARALRKGA